MFKLNSLNNRYYRILTIIVGILIFIILFFVSVDINLLWLFGRSPGIEDIRRPIQSEASLVYSADSVLLGRYFDENRTIASYEDLPSSLLNILIDTEDERFYKHHGIDIFALFSAFADIVSGSPRGASTITQQLAKNMFRTRSNYSQGILGKVPGLGMGIIKAKEMIVAIKLELLFSKEEIITMYLNTVDFGSHSFGINTAAQTYFQTTPAHLTYEQSATLVGLLKATNTYNPFRHPENSIERRNIVLRNLYNHGHMIIEGKAATKKQFDSICHLPLFTKGINTEHIAEAKQNTSTAYFLQALPAYIERLCRMGLIEGYDSVNMINIKTAGLTITTTLNTRMQSMAEEAAHEQMQIIQQRFDEHWRYMRPWQDESHKEIPDFIEKIAQQTHTYQQMKARGLDSMTIDSLLHSPHPVRVFSHKNKYDTLYISTMDSIRHMVSFMHCGFVAMEPKTRRVRAWIGDLDFDSWQYDKVLSKRQPGSTFKLFVYAEAMKQGLTPVDTRLDSWQAYKDSVNNTIWAPHNANGYFSNMQLPLKCAFAQSINSVAVTLGYEMGIEKIAATAHDMGIESELNEVPALALGASDVSLFEMVNSYATVAADGIYALPILIERIENSEGRVIFSADKCIKKTERRALDYRYAFYMQQMLRGGMTEPGGTTAALWSYIYDVASHTDFGGKTGTSNNHSDAWFVGITPTLVGGAWVGGEYRCIHFRTGMLGQGSRTALPIFGRFMNKVLSDDRFAHYRRHFSKAPSDIPQNTYRGYSVYAGPPANDSLDIFEDTPENND